MNKKMLITLLLLSSTALNAGREGRKKAPIHIDTTTQQAKTPEGYVLSPRTLSLEERVNDVIYGDDNPDPRALTTLYNTIISQSNLKLLALKAQKIGGLYRRQELSANRLRLNDTRKDLAVFTVDHFTRYLNTQITNPYKDLIKLTEMIDLLSVVWNTELKYQDLLPELLEQVGNNNPCTLKQSKNELYLLKKLKGKLKKDEQDCKKELRRKESADHILECAKILLKEEAEYPELSAAELAQLDFEDELLTGRKSQHSPCSAFSIIRPRPRPLAKEKARSPKEY